MREGDVPGEFLPWRDVLHDGPVPDDLNLAQLSRQRANYIADIGWGDASDILNSFEQRDEILNSFVNYDRVILWFEHDLYDQLQILQILDWFSNQNLVGTRLSMICTDRYLGRQTPDQIAELSEHEKPVIPEQLELASRAWFAFRQSTPMQWAELLKSDTSALPFLHGAIERQLQEYPDSQTGLSRTASSTMKIIQSQKVHPGKLFGSQQKSEQRIFMGDLSFWNVLSELLKGQWPLIKLPGKKLEFDPRNKQDVFSLTPEGKAILAGEMNWMDWHSPDRWIGGVHLSKDNIWLWDDHKRAISSK